jgi:very-short-patch-repair endonuclease
LRAIGPQKLQNPSSKIWRLASNQHGVVTRAQLLDFGLSADAIRHRVDRGRLHPIHRGVYAVGRPELTERGWWMAAVLSCGPDAVLSHNSAGRLWGMLAQGTTQSSELRLRPPSLIDVSVPGNRTRRRQGVRLHRRNLLPPEDRTRRERIPTTFPIRTLIDLAQHLPPPRLERVINEADRLKLVDPETLRAALTDRIGQHGVASLRTVLDRRTFAMTRSELERRFLPLVRRAGLPKPLTEEWVNGFEVDFFWPELGLVVETDGLTYHRTPAQQARDRVRDQAHAAAGLTPLRFTHAQIRFEPGYVARILIAVARRLEAGAA